MMGLAINPFILLYHMIISFLIMFFCCAIGIIKQFIPYKYRSKCIKGEIALVTGAGNGLGKEIAKKLAKLEVTVVVVDVDEKGNQATAKEINANGGKAFAFTCDLSKRENIYRTVNEVIFRFEQINLFST
jgi:all-trans-retinol dehydrogenase (NAD+)